MKPLDNRKDPLEMIDLRSDTVTKPTEAMRKVMAEATVGDDVYGEDPTVNRLEAMAAEMTGMEAAVFAASGTQTNLMGLLSHCERGDEYIVGQQAHTYRYEGGGAAVLGSIQPQPLTFEADGSLDLEKVAAFIKPDDIHFARTRLLCLENTQGGKVLARDYIEDAALLAQRRSLGFHLDGARVCNAAVKLGVAVSDITKHFDSVSVCLSKGLGAPVGSVLCGGKELIGKARRWRKVLGGGMRQAGIIAAAGIYALENHLLRLAEDHANASLLKEGLSGIDEITIGPASAETNMVFVSMAKAQVAPLAESLKEHGILIPADTNMRLVTHMDVSAEDVGRVVAGFKAFFSGS